MYKIILFFKIVLLVIFLFSHSAFAVNDKLTVFMVIKGMNEENINKLKPFFEKGGLRKLESESMHYLISFPHKIYGGIEGLTTLLTGTTPNIHTINHNFYFDKSDNQLKNCLHDNDFPGIGTELRLSPKSMLSPTFSDMMRDKYGDKSKIYSIGIDPQTTIVMAGHNANACCWLDSVQQQWVTTTFYSQGLPQEAYTMNIENYIYSSLNNSWTPQMDIDAYLTPTEREREKKFKYKGLNCFYHTPAINDIVLELASQIQKNEKMGKDNISDFLFLELTTITPKSTSDDILSAEQEDMYLRLNQSLGKFIQKMNSRIGEGKYKIVILGMPFLSSGKKKIEQAGYKYTKFNMDRVAALISSYLVALHGNRQWINGGFGNSIFLNKNELRKYNLDIYDVQNEIADFLMDFEGVQLALPFKDALLHPFFQNMMNKYRFGDVVFSLEPYCQEYTTENEVYDNIFHPDPTALLWIWQPTNVSIPEYMHINAEQCVNLFLQ